MNRDEIKAKLGELAKIDDEGAILPKTLLAIMETDEESAKQLLTIIEADKESASRVVDMRKEIEALKNETARRHSYNMYISIAILIVMLVAILVFIWLVK